MKDLKISTELISSVLVKETRHLTYDTIYVEDNYIIFSYDGEYQFEVNIYEFAFKCKVWAFKNNYKIQSQINASNKGHSHITKKNDDCWAKGFFENTEIEATEFKACNWILEETNDNKNI